MAKFVEYIPYPRGQFSICPDGDLISITFYLYRMEHIRFLNCIKEALYAYHQLVRHTNILMCGRIRFFVDANVLQDAIPFFRAVGLESLVVPISVPSNYHMSGFFPLLYHKEVSDCEFRFHWDADNWLLHPEWEKSLETQTPIDFIALTDNWREHKENIYGLPAEKPDWTIRASFFLGAPMAVEDAIAKIFGGSIPDKIQWLIDKDIPRSEELSHLRCASGIVVGVHRDSEVGEQMLDCYMSVEADMPGDEGFLTLFLARYSEFSVYPVFGYPVSESVICKVGFPGILDKNETTVLVNVGGGDVMRTDTKPFKKARKRLYRYIKRLI